MAEFCKRCFKERIAPYELVENLVLSDDVDFCEGCGEFKQIVVCIKKITPNKKCKKCIHMYAEYDPTLKVNNMHYYCDAVLIPSEAYGFDSVEGTCIDGFYWEKGECQYFSDKENNRMSLSEE